MWWCEFCNKSVPGTEVTFNEFHDRRYGGCDRKVSPTKAEPPSPSAVDLEPDLVGSIAELIFWHLPQNEDYTWHDADHVYRDKCRRAAAEIIRRLCSPAERCPKCEDLIRRRVCGICAECWQKAQNRPSSPAAMGRDPYWWCGTCREIVPPNAVTYSEHHDTRAGGCGMPVDSVIGEAPAPPSGNITEKQAIAYLGLREGSWRIDIKGGHIDMIQTADPPSGETGEGVTDLDAIVGPDDQDDDGSADAPPPASRQEIREAFADALADFLLAEKTDCLQQWKLPMEERDASGPHLYERIYAFLDKHWASLTSEASAVRPLAEPSSLPESRPPAPGSGEPVTWSHFGRKDLFIVHLNGEAVYQTKDARDRDLFIAELKGRLGSTPKQAGEAECGVYEVYGSDGCEMFGSHGLYFSREEAETVAKKIRECNTDPGYEINICKRNVFGAAPSAPGSEGL